VLNVVVNLSCCEDDKSNWSDNPPSAFCPFQEFLMCWWIVEKPSQEIARFRAIICSGVICVKVPVLSVMIVVSASIVAVWARVAGASP